MEKKIISLADYKKSLKTPTKFNKMLFFIIVLGAFVGAVCWNYFIENPSKMDVQITPSKNISFAQQSPIGMTSSQIANEFEKADGKPVLLYIYTTWCKSCAKNFDLINEISREFQATDLRVLALAIDKNLQPQDLQNYLNKSGELYFEPRYLAFKDGFKELLRQKNINYDNRIPFTVLLSRDGEIIAKFSGVKSRNYLRNKIIKELL